MKTIELNLNTTSIFQFKCLTKHTHTQTKQKNTGGPMTGSPKPTTATIKFLCKVQDILLINTLKVYIPILILKGLKKPVGKKMVQQVITNRTKYPEHAAQCNSYSLGQTCNRNNRCQLSFFLKTRVCELWTRVTETLQLNCT